VEPWLTAHPRVTRLWLPTHGPRAHPSERAVGDVHDLGTRHHTPQRFRDLVTDVDAPLQVTGPWQYQLSARYSEPAVTAAVENIAAEPHAKSAA
jgi:hypothetical protein